MQSDEQLVEEMRLGVQSSMEVLVKRYYKIVFAYIYRYVNDYHLAYDLTQETFVKMLRHADSLTRQSSFRYWLLKIALNICRDYFNSRSFRNGQRSVELDEQNEAALEEPQVIDMLDRKAESVAVQAALMALPTYQRETVILRFYHDLKIKDIASLTKATESTVKSRIRQGLSKLKSLMERSDIVDKKRNRH